MENGQMTGNIIKNTLYLLKSNVLFFHLYYDRPDVTNRVFYHKLKDLMADIRKNEYFGSVKALGSMVSHKMSLIPIFDHKHFRQKFHQKFDIFQEKISTASDFGSYLV